VDAVLPPDQVRAQLDRILASPEFSGAGRLSRFLQFTVERTLAGQGGDIKEYLLGTEVFDRGTDFDPRLDPIVRVEAHRLRTKLQSYYGGAGQADPVRIVFRKGSYAPGFERAEAPVPLRKDKPRSWIIAAAGVLLSLASWLLYSHSTPQVVTLAVYPFTDTADDSAFANGLGEALSAELARNAQIRVKAWPLVKEYTDRHGEPTKDSMKGLETESVLFVSVRRADARRRIAAYLVFPDRESKAWVGEYDRSVGDDLAVQAEIARAVADELGRALPAVLKR
jgi:serine/threonine-protein kinase